MDEQTMAAELQTLLDQGRPLQEVFDRGVSRGFDVITNPQGEFRLYRPASRLARIRPKLFGGHG